MNLFIGVIYAVNSITQFAAMQLVERFRSRYLITVGLVLSSLVFLLFTRATSFWEIIPLEVILATAWACLYIGSVNYVLTSGKERGTSAGLLQSSISISAIMGSMVGGAITFAFGYHGSMLVAAGLAILAIAIFLAGDSWRSKRSATPI